MTLLTSSSVAAPDPLLMAAEALDPSPKPYLTRPVEWAREVLRHNLWSSQREVLESIRDNRFTAVKSCHASGKSFIAADAAGWWLDQHPPGEAFVVTTAPTWPQVRAILWRYIGQIHARGKLAGRVNQTEWHMDPTGTHREAPHPTEAIVAYGRKPANTAPEGFSGIHARYVLVIIDEAGGIPKALWDAVDTLATNVDCRVLAIGNPDYPDSHFATVCAPGTDWHVITISAFDTPNFTDEGEIVDPEVLINLVSREWVEERKRRWGEDSPLYVAKVLGEFPETAADTVIPLGYVRRAQAERLYRDHEHEPVELGVDVGAGQDKTVIRCRRGIKAAEVWRYSTPDPMEAVGHVVKAIRATGATSVKVDSIGVGWGVWGRLVELGTEKAHNAVCHPVNVARASTDPARFPNLRSQLWWEARERCGTPDGHVAPTWDLSACDDDTVADLIAPRYKTNSHGQYVVEPKEDTIERLGRSPDDADALLLAFHVPSGGVTTDGTVVEERRRGRR